jgi:hypothetical protein
MLLSKCVVTVYVLIILQGLETLYFVRFITFYYVNILNLRCDTCILVYDCRVTENERHGVFP